MDLPQPSRDALAQPTRAEIFGFLAEKRAPAATDEIARSFGLHPNGVRRHLERLLEGGFVTRSQLRTGQGRPRDVWAVSPDAHPGGQRPKAYADLSSWLARAMPDDAEHLRSVEETGRAIGREIAVPSSEDPVESFKQAVAALGFQPVIDNESDAGFSCTLRNCPYRETAQAYPGIVCSLHRGITSGLLETLAPDAELTDFEIKDPETADCRLTVSLPASD